MINYDALFMWYLETDADLEALTTAELKKERITDLEMTRRLRRFVLEEGNRFPLQAFPTSRFKLQPIGESFWQSLRLSIDAELTFVEGFALSPNKDVALHHAWCTDSNGLLVDSTWGNTGRGYFGVQFASDYVWERWKVLRSDWGMKPSLLDDAQNEWAIINRKTDRWRHTGLHG
jgi:hypothetical protein